MKRIKKLEYILGVLSGEIHFLKIAINMGDPQEDLIFRLDEMERLIKEKP